MSDDIVKRLLDFKPLNDADLARLMLDSADEIERLRAELTEAVISCYSMVRQYCEMHGKNELWSHFLGAPANAMRICDYYGLLDNFLDNGSRDVWADVNDDRDIEAMVAKAVRGD